jgi:hypothetical protein
MDIDYLTPPEYELARQQLREGNKAARRAAKKVGVKMHPRILARFVAPRAYKGGKATYMAHGKSYVMARRPGCAPFVVTEKEWREMPLFERIT